MGDTNTELPQSLTVGDLTQEHYGWSVSVDDPRLFLHHREISLLQHCIGRYRNRDKAGVMVQQGASDRRILGTEFHYPAETPCRLV